MTRPDKNSLLLPHEIAVRDGVLMPAEAALRDRFIEATTSSPGRRVLPVEVRDGDCYLVRTAFDELEALRAKCARSWWDTLRSAMSRTEHS